MTRSNSSPLTLTNVRTLIGAKSSGWLHLSDSEMRNFEGMFEFSKHVYPRDSCNAVGHLTQFT